MSDCGIVCGDVGVCECEISGRVMMGCFACAMNRYTSEVDFCRYVPVSTESQHGPFCIFNSERGGGLENWESGCNLSD